MRVIVTNDDGIDSPGLHTLVRCVVDLGWLPVVAAPATESSGTSAGLTAATAERQVVVERRRLPNLPDVEAYAVAAHPGLITLIACQNGFGDEPDLVLSGINHGANVGRAILHSGTVGAALTAAVNGIPAVAVSLDVPVEVTSEPHWATAAGVVRDLAPTIADLAAGRVLNVNVPDVPRLPGPPRWAGLATYGRVRNKVTQVEDGLIEVDSIEVAGELEAGTDAALLAEGHATRTPVHSVGTDERLLAAYQRGS